MIDVSIIIVNFNGKHFLKSCLDSVLNQIYRSYEVIMIDNSSTDGSVKFVKKHYKEVKIIKNKENNYTQAINKGIAKSTGKYVVTLNNDTTVKKDWLSNLIKVIKKRNAAAVQSKVLLTNGNLNGVGLKEMPNFKWILDGYDQNDHGQFDYEKELRIPYGVSVIYDKKKLVKVGLFDEDFEHYVDEIDIAYRLRKRKYKIYFAPHSVVIHKYKGTHCSTAFKYYNERNRLYYVAKYFPEKLPVAITTSDIFYSFEPEDYRLLFEIIPQAVRKLRKYHKKSVDIIIEIVEQQKLIFDFLRHNFYLKEKELNREFLKEKRDYEKKIQDLIHNYEKEFFRLRKIIRGFYTSRGYKYILKPIERIYRILFL